MNTFPGFGSKTGRHLYLGRNVGRGCRENSKLHKALNGVASPSLLDQIAREDARRRRQQQRQEVAA